MKLYYLIEFIFGVIILLELIVKDILCNVSRFYHVPMTILIISTITLIVFVNGGIKADFNLNLVRYTIGFMILLLPVLVYGIISKLI